MLVEQRYQAVLEVVNGATVSDVARRYGVVRQTVHGWLRRYASQGLAGLVDRSSKPVSCPHQTPVEVEARIRGDAAGSSGLGSADDRLSP
jgi:transposase-like protein